MFDQTPPAWIDELRIGDLVLCDLPPADRPEEAALRRPWLLLDRFTRTGGPCLALAPLQQARLQAQRGYEIVVAMPRDLRSAGLRRRAVFACRRPRIVPVEEFRGTRIGRLQGDRLERLNAVRARLDAERDIRRERLLLADHASGASPSRSTFRGPGSAAV